MSARVSRLKDPGLSGKLDLWPAIAAEHVESGEPVQRGMMVLDEAASGTSVGIWDCTAWIGTMGPYSVHEFMIILEGAVTIAEPSGKTTTVSAGESFVIPKGLVCQWRQTGPLRKFFVIFDDQTGAVQPSGQQLIKLDLTAPLQTSAGPDHAVLVSETVPHWQERIVNTDPTGQWTVGLWSSTPYERKIVPFPRHELMHILEGTVTLTSADGERAVFQPGDTFFVPQGTHIGWHCSQSVKKLYCAVQPQSPA
jgi:uncharacterized cupin superfamily protein